jgi:deferrochelatase/peroxidase EfeB
MDDSKLGADDDANNNFLFQHRLDPKDGFGPAEPDPEGIVCPLSAHTRNAFPRDDVAPGDQQQRRLLRRGITFGPLLKVTPDEPIVADGVPRGLLFLAYMTSISRQFEAVNDGWSDSADVRVGGVRTDALLRGRWIIPTGGAYYFAPSVSAIQEQLSTV